MTPTAMAPTAPAEAGPDFAALQVAIKEEVARGVVRFELRHPEGLALPAFTAGAHLTVQLPNGARRNYSLCGDPAETGFYELAVKRDAGGRGGSVCLCDDVQVGDLLPCSAPRNNFGLPPTARQFIFVAGGIGITPILSMVRHLAATGEGSFRLFYCTRDAESTAFAAQLAELAALAPAGSMKIHHDGGNPDKALDLWPVFERPAPAHVYCCGPQGLMDSVRDMTGHWPTGQIHFESFGADTQVRAQDTAFRVRLQRRRDVFDVPVGKSILDVLRGCGVHVPSSCESGTCGSCRTGLLQGQAEHRDMVLTPDEQGGQIMVCVSRAVSPELVLDL